MLLSILIYCGFFLGGGGVFNLLLTYVGKVMLLQSFQQSIKSHFIIKNCECTPYTLEKTRHKPLIQTQTLYPGRICSATRYKCMKIPDRSVYEQWYSGGLMTPCLVNFVIVYHPIHVYVSDMMYKNKYIRNYIK